MSATLQSICSEQSREWCTSVSHHLLAACTELAVLVPLRPPVAERELAADFVQRLGVFGDATEIPLRIEVVERRVVAVGGVVVERLASCGRAAVYHVIAGLGHQCGHAGLGKAEVVGAVVEA